MIEKLGSSVGKTLNLTGVENVQQESASVGQNIPEEVEASHAFQEVQFAQSRKSELAMFGSLQQILIGAELERNKQPSAKLMNGGPTTSPTTISPAMQELLEKLEHLKAQKQVIASEMNQLLSELANIDPKADTDRYMGLAVKFEELQHRLAELDLEIKNVLSEIQFVQKIDKEDEEPERMVTNRTIPLW